MSRATRPEPVGARKKVVLVYGFQYHDNRPLTHLIFEGWNAKGPKRSRSIRLRNVHSPNGWSLIAARLDALQEVHKIGFQVLRVLCRYHPVDARGTVLAGEPVGFPHPLQVDDVVQRGQSHPAFRSCQFSYPLPFRVQVCKAQSPLLCPVSGSLHATPPFPRLGPGEVRFPNVISIMRALRLPTHAFPVTYLFRSRDPRDPSLIRAPCCQRSRADGGSDPGQDHCSAGDPFPALVHVDVSGISQVPRRPILCLCPVPRPRSNRRSSPMTVPSMLPLRPSQQRLRHCSYRGYHGASAPAVYASRTVLPPPHARLASGWLAGLYRGGVEPTGSR